MAWSTPRVWSVGEVLTAANMNQYVSSDLAYLYGVLMDTGYIGTAQATFVLNPVDQTFNNLRIWVVGATTRSANSADAIGIQFNGDTGSNYQYLNTKNVNSTVTTDTSAGTTSLLAGYLPGAGRTANYAGFIDLAVPNYADLGAYYTTVTGNAGQFSTNTQTNAYNYTVSGIYHSLVPVTEVTIFSIAGASFDVGTRCVIRGEIA